MPKNIGKTLKEYRAASKMSVKDISILLTKKGYKASESTIYSWENGNSQPTPGALLTMCKAYGIEDVLLAFGYNGYKEDGSLMLDMSEIEIIEKYRDLDGHGKEMVDFTLEKEWERSTDSNKITGIPTYLKTEAAHERTDAEITDEMRKNDNDIMDNDDLWK